MELPEKDRLIYMLGIGGIGMSAIAKVLLQKGHQIAGSDMRENTNTIRLRELGATIHIGHKASQVRNASIIVYSSAINKDTNCEYQEALTQNIPIYSRATMLNAIFKSHINRIAISGTHGKTTTSSMLTTTLRKLKIDPTFLIGGIVEETIGNAALGKDGYCIAEADESDGSIMLLDPNVLILTNLEAEHLDYFGSLENIINTFVNVIKKLPPKSLLVINGDHPGCEKLLEKIKNLNLEIKITTFGFEKNNDITATIERTDKNITEFKVKNKGETIGKAFLSIPGAHNVSNALAIITYCLEINLSFVNIASAIKDFQGAGRRFQLIGKTNKNIAIYDDYAHHPTEIRATLEAAKNGWPKKRIVAVFQPHRFSRTMFFAKEFAECFEHADAVIITDIYPAGEKPIENVTGKMVADLVSNVETIYLPKKENISKYLVDKILQKDDMLITLGAGDINTVGKEVLSRLRAREAKDKTNETTEVKIT
ncbi:UDP-N-acetylmuramate--L-alanine ligase [Candidatus Margulisiibacteriota bacterium]